MSDNDLFDEIVKAYEPFKAVAIFDHAVRTTYELDFAVVDLAVRLGWQAPFAIPDDEEDGSDAAYEAAILAIDWLNDERGVDGAYWGHHGDAGAFGLWAIEDDEE